MKLAKRVLGRYGFRIGSGIGAALLLIMTTATWAGDAPLAKIDEVLQCMRANVPQSLQIKEIQLTATDRSGGSRTLRGRLYARRENGLLRAMIRIASPSDLSGASYLSRQRENGDDMYVYMPTLAKVRRINGASAEGTLWGTDLSYADIRQINGAFSNTDAHLEKLDTLDQRPAYIITMKPDAAEGSTLTQLRAWVDQKSCIALRVDFNDAKGPRKRLTVDARNLRQDGKYWYAGLATMTDLIGGTHTDLQILGVSPDKDLADRYFNPATFYIGL